MSEENKQTLEVYSQGVYDANLALKDLTDYFRSIDEETWIVFFGDHLPTLGKNFSAYRQAGYVSEKQFTAMDTLRLHTVPFLIWNNKVDTVNTVSDNLGTINIYTLGPLILDKANVKMHSYFSYLDDKRSISSVCLDGICKDGGETVPVEKVSEEASEFIETRTKLQYREMFDS